MNAVLVQLWRRDRFEFVALVLVSSVLTGVALALAMVLISEAPPVECTLGQAARPERCDAILDGLVSYRARLSDAQTLLGVMAFLPIVAGAVLGATLVAREIEQRTAQLAWSLAPSRRRWFLERASIGAIAIVLLLLAPATAGHVLESAVDPSGDPWHSLRDFGSRGPSIVLRGLAIFAVGLAAGAVLGRVLPALLVSGAAGLLIVAVGLPMAVIGMSGEVFAQNGTAAVRRGIGFDTLWQSPSGELLTQEEVIARAPQDGSDPYVWADTNHRQVVFGISGRRYPEAELRSAAILGGVTIVSLGIAGGVVLRRRPE